MKRFIKKYKYYIVAVILVFISYMIIDNDILKFNMQDSSGFELNVSNFLGALFMEAFVSIHMTVFVLSPVVNILNNPKITLKELFLGRVVILLICDILISPMLTAIIDFMMVFIGVFIIVPILAVTRKQNPFAKNDLYIKNIDVDQNVKYELSTLLARYLFALSEKDKQEIENITSKKMCDDTFKMIDNAETYNKRNVIDDIDIQQFDILVSYANKNEECIHAKIIMNALDYVEYGMTSMQKKRKYYEYKIIFKKIKDNKAVKVELERCPHCGASILDKSILTCDYCGNLLAVKKNEWLIEKLEKTLLK